MVRTSDARELGEGVFYVCGAPILLAVVGFILFAIIAVAYNLLAKFVGGIEVEITTTGSEK